MQFDSEPSGAEMRSIIDYACGGPCSVRDDRPQAAAAYIEDERTPTVPGPACITPCTVQVARNQELIVTFTKVGYEPQTVKLQSKLAAGGAVGVAGNAIIGGGIGLVVDAGTGAALDHQPNPLKVILQPVPAAPTKRR